MRWYLLCVSVYLQHSQITEHIHIQRSKCVDLDILYNVELIYNKESERVGDYSCDISWNFEEKQKNIS